MKKILIISILIIFGCGWIKGQAEEKKKFIQIDGMTNDENGNLVPYVSIFSKHLRRGAASDSRGIFSIISIPGDTGFFSAIGYKPTLLTIPPDISGINFITDIRMITDTVQIGAVYVLPWKTYAEFKRDMLSPVPVDPRIRNMEYNLALIEHQVWQDMKSTPGQGYRYSVQQISDNAYTRGQIPSQNIFSPIAWSKFIKEAKGGLLKNEKSTKHSKTKTKVRKKKKSN